MMVNPTKRQKELIKIFEEEVFVTAWAATEAAKFYFNEIEKIDRFCLCYQGEFSVNSKL